MKKLAMLIIVLAFLGLLAFKNPTMEDYNDFLRQAVVKEFQRDSSSALGQLLTPLMGGLAGKLVASWTVRTDLVFFSYYEAKLGNRELKVVGALNNFFIWEEPRF